MTTRTIVNILSACAFGLVAQSAAAVVIHAQAPTPGGVSTFSSTDGGSQVADSFALSQDVVLNRISWWGTATSSLDAFEVLIYARDGAPALTPLITATGTLSQTATALADSAGASIFRYDLEGAFALLSGDYSLAVGNNGLTEWWWLAAAADNSSFFRMYSDENWALAAGDLAFQLETADAVAVSEPGALTLFALGLAALLAQRASRRKRNIDRRVL